jgi:hypothetical protein
MNWYRGARAAAAGLVAFVLLYLLWIAFTLYILSHISLIGGGSSRLDWNDWLIVAPIVLGATVAAALPARALGASWWRSLVSAAIACILAISIDTNHWSYAPFNRRETFAYVVFVTGTIVLALVGRSASSLRGLAVAMIVALGLSGLILVMAQNGTWGFLVAFVAWVCIPASAGLIQARTGAT